MTFNFCSFWHHLLSAETVSAPPVLWLLGGKEAQSFMHAWQALCQLSNIPGSETVQLKSSR